MTIVNGTTGNDELVTSDAGDILNGLSGNDRLTSFHDGAKLNAGQGNDFLVVDSYALDEGRVENNRLDGGSGSDTLESYGSLDCILDGGSGDDFLRVFAASVDTTVIGGSGNDDFLLSDSLRTTAHGGSGDDYFQFAFQHDSTAKGGSGNDVFFLQESATGNLIDGDSGDDRFDVWVSGNTLNGGSGDDLFEFHQDFRGGIVVNMVSGETGHDVFRFHLGNDGGPIIQDFHLGGGAEDLLDLQPLFEEAGLGGQEVDWLVLNGSLLVASSAGCGGDAANDTVIQVDADGFGGSGDPATFATLWDVTVGSTDADANNWLVEKSGALGNLAAAF